MADKPTTPPPAYFLSLSLENVRSFGAKQTISFVDKDNRLAKWTIILGDNGVGKTTVLKSLAAMVTEDRPIERQDPYGIAAMWRLANSVWLPFRYGNTRPAQLDTLVLQDISLETGEAGKDALIVEAHVGKTNGGGMMTSGHNPRSLICYGYGAGRSIGNSTLSEAPEAADTCASLFDDRADLLNPEEWFLFADYRMAKDKDPLTTQNFHLIKAALLKIMEEGEVTDLDVAPVQSNGGSPRQGVRFKTPYGWVRLRDMSLGYQTLVVWLTDLADKLFVRYPDSKNPLEEPAIVLIDEIDLHLHPSWQRKLLKSLGEIFKNTQFIATAHSPLVVQAASDAEANVVLLKREGDQTIVYQNPEDVRGWRVDQILTSSFFNLETARSVKTEEKLARQAALLNKAKLTAKERRELEALTQELEGQPMGSTSPHAEAEEAELLRQITERLGSQPTAGL
jgi:energy-coupling factor transporter ATP-binding protein EcfA2